MSDQFTESSGGGVGSYLLSTATTLLLRTTKLVVGLGAVVATLLYFKQDSMLYFPGKTSGVEREICAC